MRRRSLHDRVLIFINYVTGTMALVSACLMDAETWIPYAVFTISVSWLLIFAYANGYFDVKE